MRPHMRIFVVPSAAAVLLLGCESKRPLESSREPDRAPQAGKAQSGFATLATLPALSKSVSGEAYAVDRAGSIIVGYSWDQAGRMHPVTWTLQNGAWKITALPYPSTATSATARAVNDLRQVAGYSLPASTPRPLRWSATGAFEALGCGELGEAYGITADGQIVVGAGRSPAAASVWRQAGQCREDLPPLFAGGSAGAYAVNGDGTIVGGLAAPFPQSTYAVPVRWRRVAGAWQVEQLDSRQGRVSGANTLGDLVGHVTVPCTWQSTSDCTRAFVWPAAGGSRELPTLGGETTAPRAINAAGEVVGLSTLANGDGTAFIWSETLGIRQLPVANGAWAFGVSDVRPDGTRLVVGAGGKPFAALTWVVRNP